MAVEFVAVKLAESIVSQAIERIADLLIDEASSLSGVSSDIQSLQSELKWIQSFLKDADKKQEKDERVRIWIAEVRDVACEIEDVIETYVYKVQTSYVKAAHLRKLRAQVNSIKDKLRNIGERRQRYQIEFPNGDQEPESLKKWRRSYPDEEEDDVITLKSTMAALKDQLMRLEDRRCVVSIVGMGGLGKTTLAKKAYNDVDVKKDFSCSAWVFISQQFLAREVLIEILMQVGFRSDKHRRALERAKYTKEFVEERRNNREILKGLEDHELVALLKSELNEKRYLIVLDDIWSVDAWNSIEKAFPKGKLGSKVVFTTRIKEVAVSADPYSAPIEPPLLTEQESWELLQRKAFPREIFGGRGCPPEFEELGKEMVAECGGLPLAIVVLGGLLGTKNSLDKWEKVKKDVKLQMINKLKSERQYRVEDILDLSFQELPFYLKPCFLYLGSFPEDSEIPKRRLIRLWIAEGFIRSRETEANGMVIEDLGEQYLEELIDRCMVQIDKNDHTGKGVKTCRLHDLMRDFCLSKAKEELFLEITQQNEITILMAGSSSSSSSSYVQYCRSRRIAVHINHGLHHHSSGTAERVQPRFRSLLCFSVEKLPNFSNAKANFLLLRVLHLDFLDRAELPDGIGNLIHLRYLRVSGSRGYGIHFPHSLGNLRNLQTLDLYGYTFLPSSVWRLKQLRYLLLPLSYTLPWWSFRRFFGGQAQIKLVTLKGIHAKDLIKHKSVLPMPNIKVLGITNLTSDREVTLVLESLDSRSQLGKLRSLMMSEPAMHRPAFSFPKMELLSHCQVLSKLELSGTVPDVSLTFLPKSLAKLTLSRSMLNQSKIAILEKLQNLRVLELSYEFKLHSALQKWVFSAGGFAKLEVLTLLCIYNLGEWEVNEGSMSNLRQLDITDLYELKTIPEGLRYVTTLREMCIRLMTREFEDRLRMVNQNRAEGEDFYKVRHVPSVTFSDTLID